MYCTLIFWLLIATPVPLKIDIIEEDAFISKSSYLSKSMEPAIAFNLENISVETQFPTILTAIGYRE